MQSGHASTADKVWQGPVIASNVCWSTVCWSNACWSETQPGCSSQLRRPLRLCQGRHVAASRQQLQQDDEEHRYTSQVLMCALHIIGVCKVEGQVSIGLHLALSAIKHLPPPPFLNYIYFILAHHSCSIPTTSSLSPVSLRGQAHHEPLIDNLIFIVIGCCSSC